jgi:ribosomal subunit interface protein
MEIVVKGRHIEVSDSFREHVFEKLSRLERYDHRSQRVDVEVSIEKNPRQSDKAARIELTLHSRGPVVRAEANAADKLAALDRALDKLESRLRKSADRRRIHHGQHAPMSLHEAAAHPYEEFNGVAAANGTAADDDIQIRKEGPLEVMGDGPLVVREKAFKASPMSLDQALYEMELVGHDFYLFIDEAHQAPSVVYRRHGYDYGVIRLEA